MATTSQMRGQFWGVENCSKTLPQTRGLSPHFQCPNNHENRSTHRVAALLAMLWHFGQVAVMLHHWSTSQRHGTAYYKEDVGVYADHADYHEPGSYDEYDQEPGYYQEDPTYYADEEDPNGGEPFFDDPAHCEEPTATEEADLLNDEKEAYAIAQEANRTLQQARQAVAKARAARGYFPVGGKDTGRGKGGTPKGKTNGPCYVCGQMGHVFYECPKRFASGGSHPAARKARARQGKASRRGRRSTKTTSMPSSLTRSNPTRRPSRRPRTSFS